MNETREQCDAEIEQIIEEGMEKAKAEYAQLRTDAERWRKLRELARQLPANLESDWNGTNHYELTVPNCGDDGDYWWIDLKGLFFKTDAMPCDTEFGKRVGLLLDIAAELSRLESVVDALPLPADQGRNG